MPTPRKLLIGLDLGPHDESLLRYASGLCARIEPLILHFVHIHPTPDLPDALKGNVEESQSVEDSILAEMQKKVDAHFTYSENLEGVFHSTKGDRVKKIERYVKDMRIDLVILGRKEPAQGTGTLSQQLLRHCPASIMLVPGGIPFKGDTILVPLDLTNYSFLGLERAAQIADETEPDELLISVYAYALKLPMGFYRRGKHPDEVKQIMREHAEKRYHNFMDDISLPVDVRVEPVLVDATEEGRVEAVCRIAREREAELIVVGARQPSFAAGLIMSDFAKRLIKLSGNIPVLILRQRGKRFGLFDAIKEI
jgi:nucleotide-binding universal stress UspA family protein